MNHDHDNHDASTIFHRLLFCRTSIRWSMDATTRAAGTAGTSLAPKCGAGACGATGSRGAAAGAAPRAVRSESIFLGKRRNLGRFWDVESLWKSVEFLDICDEATKLIKSDCSFTHAARSERNLPFSNQGVWYTCMSFKAPKTFAERCDFKNG
jgi:hypothetical protein